MGKNNMQTMIVTAAIIIDGPKILIAQRKKGTHLEMKWEFPGGKLEPGEDPETCLEREIKEELALDIKVNSIFQVVSHKYELRHIVMLCYICEVLQGTPECIECNDFRWVTLDEIGEYDFAPADIPVVEKLLKTTLG